MRTELGRAALHRPEQSDCGRKTIYMLRSCTLPRQQWQQRKKIKLPSALLPLAIIAVLDFVRNRVDRAVNVLGLGSKRAVRARTAVNRSIFEL